MPVPRALTHAEHDVIQWMIAQGGVDVRIYLDQLPGVMVAQQCACGCATIDFLVPRARTGFWERFVIGDYVYGPEDLPFGVLLIAMDGTLSRLETYSSTAQPAPLPAPRDLRQWSGEREKPTEVMERELAPCFPSADNPFT